MATVEESIDLLGKVPVFAELAPDDLRRVAEVAVPRRFGAQQVIFREGDSSDTCYVVRKGHARAVRENADGRTMALAHFNPGDIFGELAMLVKATQSEIAQLAGSSRESASRFLAVLERAGIITQGRGRITVHDPDALANYVY